MSVSLWNPKYKKEDGGERRLRPRAGDLYAAVEELDEDTTVLTLTPWPTAGKKKQSLRFRSARTIVRSYSTSELQKTLDRAVEAAGQLRRPLRTGDVFLIRMRRGVGVSGAVNRLSADPESWHLIRDVTAAAREAARAAFHAAVTPVVLSPRVRTRGHPWPEPVEPQRQPERKSPESAHSAGTVAYPSV